VLYRPEQGDIVGREYKKYKKKNNNNKVKSKPLEFFEFAGKNRASHYIHITASTNCYM
jgi:hypothetical protein